MYEVERTVVLDSESLHGNIFENKELFDIYLRKCGNMTENRNIV
jgi:hypothetical protein